MATLAVESDKIVVFSEYRSRVASLGDEFAEMSTEDVQKVVALLDERIETTDQRVIRVVPTGPARPFFDAALADARWGKERPRTDPEARHSGGASARSRIRRP